MTNPTLGTEHPVILDEELYDGPVPGRPNGATAWVPPQAHRVEPAPVSDAAVKLAFDILSTRALGLVATVSACAIWGFAVWAPEVSRTYAALGFSGTVLVPIVWLYLKRG